MGSEDPKKKSDRLARIRENQRKSRAKKQEHTRELEQKLAFLQEQANRKDVENRLAIQQLQAENRKLKYLLSCSGLSETIIQGYLQAAGDPAVAQKVAIPAIRKPEPEPSSRCKPTDCSRRCPPPQKQPEADTTPQKTSNPPLATTPPTKTEEPAQETPAESTDQSICNCLPTDGLGTMPTNEDVLNTTLCAIAEELISQYNTRGVDMQEIRRKLWAGFSKGLTTDEGCRVQNHILFQVLDEISNN